MNYEPLFTRPFNASRWKIKRARKHVADLERLTAEFWASSPVTTRVKLKDELEPGALIGFETTWRAPTDEYSATFGDAVHNLRTALDLLATDMVRANGRNPKGVYFPFAHDAKDLDHQIKVKNFNRAGSAAVDLLKQFAPYTDGNALLRALHDLDVADKHVCLTPNGIMFNSPLIKVVGRRPDGFPELEVVEETPTLTDMRLVFPVGYPFANEDVIEVLHKFVDLVDGIVEAFEALCLRDGIDLDDTPNQLKPTPLLGGGEIQLVRRTDPNGESVRPVAVSVQSGATSS